MLTLILLLSACKGESPDPTDTNPTDTQPADTQPADTDTGPVDTGEPPPAVWVPPAGEPPADLAELQLFTWDAATSTATFTSGVVPYSLNTPLFTDYAVKQRALYVPPDQAAAFQASGVLDFPVGSVLVKNFMLPADLSKPDQDLRLLETRLLIRQADGWEQWPYVWSDDGSAATLDTAGRDLAASFVDLQGETVDFSYRVPGLTECAQCHTQGLVTPIGPTARNLNQDIATDSGTQNQLQALANLGVLTDLPALSEVDAATVNATELDLETATKAQLEAAARDYLDVNCAHCHSEGGAFGSYTGLWLNHDETDPLSTGICRSILGPRYEGLTHNIVPGHADQSNVVHRLGSVDAGVLMPRLGRTLAHQEAVDLVAAWIDSMEPQSCD